MMQRQDETQASYACSTGKDVPTYAPPELSEPAITRTRPFTMLAIVKMQLFSVRRHSIPNGAA